MNYTVDSVNDLIDAYAQDLAENPTLTTGKDIERIINYYRNHKLVMVDLIIRLQPQNFVELVMDGVPVEIEYTNLKKTYERHGGQTVNMKG
jgi:hypothetical protein